jgi:membrane-bound metal-dependent hydrolase YbcI (DUF457 family)
VKGISHFVIGVGAASCFPAAVAAAADGNPLYFILGGVFGLLPDTIDFKFAKFFYKTDITVTPDPHDLDVKMIAEAVALAVNTACETRKPVTIKLNTIQLGADRWRRYSVVFDIPGRRVIAKSGPIVDTGGKPIPGMPKEKIREAAMPLICDIRMQYFATTNVDIFDGPVFRMDPLDDGRVSPDFIPWHRDWTHSLVFALLFGLVGTLVWNAAAGMVIFAAYVAHIFADQLGYMGSNLFAPFTKRRTGGLRLTRAMWPFPNFLCVWISCVVVFWNLHHSMPGNFDPLNPIRVLALWIGIPSLVFAYLQRRANICE